MVHQTETAELVAPSTLGPGYRLVAEVNGVIKTVIVPDGGVIKGQSFVGVVEQSSKAPMGIPFNRKTAPKAVGDGNPTGRWRDRLCDCCVLGVCYSMCCTSCFVDLVMTRMSRSWCGGVGDSRDTNNTCRVLTVVFATYTVLMIIPCCIIKDKINFTDYHGTSVYNNAVACLSILNIVFWGYITIATVRTRRIIRNTYKIPTSMPSNDDDCGCDDLCCSNSCFVCTVGQMARHTNDYDVYPVDHCSGACFNKTGQSAAAPAIVV